MLVLVACFICGISMAETAEEMKTRLSQNTYYRLKNYYNNYAVDANGMAGTMSSSNELTNAWSSIWKIVPQGTGYTFQNVLTKKYLNSPAAGVSQLGLSDNAQTFYIKPSSVVSSNNYVCISQVEGAAQQTVVHTNSSGRIVLWYANTSATNNNASDWLLEPIASIDENALQAYITATTPKAGTYYYIYNKEYSPKRLQSPTTASVATVEDSSYTEFRQLWQLESLGNSRYAFKNVATGMYLQNNGVRSGDFVMGTQSSPFSFSFSTGSAPYYFSATGTSIAIHAGKNQGYRIVGWDASSNASQWYLEESTVTAAEVQAAIDAMQAYQSLTNNASLYTSKLALFFEDNACTQLKSTYTSKSDADLRSLMNAEGLPTILQEMAVRIKNNQWNTYSTLANEYEKSFRIASYTPHSDPTQWARQNSLMKTNYIYSFLTSPTGITANKGETICLFVDKNAPTGTTLEAELTTSNNTTGRRITLQQGANFIYAENTEHIYIKYNITNTNLRIADLPPVTIHIENGRANGYFDVARHENKAWSDMLSLKGAGFMQDNEWRMKSKRYTYIFNLSEVELASTRGDFVYRGQDKGLKGVLMKWDDLCDQQLDFMSIERYEDRFNCLLIAVSQANGNLFATTYGIYGVGSLKYQLLVESYENSEGAGQWALTHETGHHFQNLFTMLGAGESSNNLFSNIAMWKTGTNVSRGMSLPTLINNGLNSDKSWMDIGLSERMRLYWQLYLYYVELGHKPTFFKELFDKFRANPMIAGNAKTDFLQFAKFCSDVAGEDLTEFFEFYGFFRKTGTQIRYKWGDNFYDNYYTPIYTDVAQADIDEAKTYMAQYPKRNNLFFIDERIRPITANNIYMLPGATRYATSSNATPGDANEVGDGGHYTDYINQRPPVPQGVQLYGRSFAVVGENIVGYKAYDATGKLVWASNRHNFDIPATLDMTTLHIVASGADGTDVSLFKNGSIVAEFNKLVENKNFENTAALALSTDMDQPQYLYNIHVTPNNTAYLDGSTIKTTTEAQRGKFAFYPGTAAGTYYIYSTTINKWLGYSNTNVGNNRVTFHDTKAQASQWKVTRENAQTETFDIQPLYNDNGWNWYGGMDAARTSIGLYGIQDTHSSWTFIPTDAATTYMAEVNKTQQLLEYQGAGYPTTTAAVRSNLSEKLDAYKTAYQAYLAAATESAKAAASATLTTTATNLKTAATAYMNEKTDITMPENGKMYRIKYVHNRYAITSHRMPENAEERTITLAPCTDARSYWVCQYNADGTFYLASLKGNGCLNLTPTADVATLSDTGLSLQAARGNKFGTLYMRGGGYTYMGQNANNYLQATNATQVAATVTTQATDFYFEEVTDSAFTLAVKSGTNGNLSTINLPYAVVLPTDAKIYGTVKLSGDLKLQEHMPTINSKGERVLPPYTPVILSTSTSGDITLSPTASTLTTIATGMQGTISRLPNSSLQLAVYHYYAMTQDNGTFLMRKIRNAAIPANKAYYRIAVAAAPAPPMSANFIFDDETTGIGVSTTSTPENKEESIYDLSGRRVQQKAGNGVVIINGKKTIQPTR